MAQLLLCPWVAVLLLGQVLGQQFSPPPPQPSPPSPSPPPGSAAAQSLTVPYQTSCTSAQFFNAASMNCASCLTGYFPSTDQLQCTSCDSNSGAFYNFDSTGFSVTQNWTTAVASGTRSCACSAASNRTVIATVESYGASLQRCVRCLDGTAPNAAQQCIPTGWIFRGGGWDFLPPHPAPLAEHWWACMGLCIVIKFQARSTVY